MARRTLSSAPLGEGASAPGSAARRAVGRESELATLIGRLVDDGCSGTLVSGDPGVGRTRLLETAQGDLAAAGLPVHRLPVTRAGMTLPELPVVPRERRPLLVLDDVHLLDPTTATGLHDLVVSGRARALISQPTGAPVAEPILALVKDGYCPRLPLGRFPRESCDDLVTEVAGAPADAATARQIWKLTDGHPRLVVDLVTGLADDAPEVGADGRWTWEHPERLPRDLARAVLADLGPLGAADQEALDLLACAGPTSPDVLLGAGARQETLEALERRGIITARPSGRRLVLEFPTLMLARAARQQVGPLRARRLKLRLAQAWAEHERRREDDLARSAELLLDAGGTPAGKIAEAGARQAVGRADFRLAERLARSALQSGLSASATGYLAEALSSQGKAKEAESALRTAEATHLDPSSLQLVRASHLRWELADRATSRSLVEKILTTSCPPKIRTVARISLAGFQLHDGRFAEALTLAEEILGLPRDPADPPDLGAPRAYQAYAVSIAALTSLGRDQEAVEQARAVLRARRDRVGGRPPTLHLHQFAAAATRAFLVHGALDEAEDLARFRYERACGHHLLATAAWASLLGEVLLVRGQVRTAVRLLEEAHTALRRSAAGGLVGRTVHVMVTKNLARAHLLSGRAAEARRTMEGLTRSELRNLAAVDLWTGDVEGALAAEISPERGVQLVLHASRRLRDRRSWAPYVAALHQVVRLGGAALLPADALVGVAVQGPALQTQVAHVRAAVAADPAALEAVSQRFVRFGAQLFGAEAAADAARLHDAAGQDGAARRAAAVAQACVARCEDVSTPVTALLREPTNLTPRQREIARLAARGMPSKGIAEQLVLSVRTVDNCLGQVYRKLGIVNRAELPLAMGVGEPDRRGDHDSAHLRAVSGRRRISME